MDVTKHYQKYWKGKKTDKFFDYERNLLLPLLFKDVHGKILDLGCGDATTSEYFQKKLGLDVVGADISTHALNKAKKRGIKTVLIDEEKNLPFKDKSFDVVFWGDNVEHLFNPAKTLAEIKRILKPSGRLILSCPNMGYWRYRLHFFSTGSLPDTEWTGNPPWFWSHIRFFNYAIMKRFIESGGLKIIRFEGVNRRVPDKYFVKWLPNIFSMIMVVEAVN